jgi:hypothetical protein
MVGRNVGTASKREVFRRPWQNAVASFGLAFMSLVFLGFVLGMAVEYFWVGVGLSSTLAVFNAWAAIRAARLGVVADSRGLTLRNILTTRRLAWAEVDCVLPATNAVRGVRIRRVDGKQVQCGGLALGQFEGPGRLNRVAERSQARVAAELAIANGGWVGSATAESAASTVDRAAKDSPLSSED